MPEATATPVEQVAPKEAAAGVEAKPVAKAEAKPEPKEAKAKANAVAEESDTEGEDEVLTFKSSELKKRIDRAVTTAQKKALKDELGVEDFKEVKSKLAKLQKMEEGAEEERKAKLTEQERMREELKKAKEDKAKAEARAKAVEEARAVDEQTAKVKELSDRHVKPKYFRLAEEAFIDHARENWTDAHLKNVKPSDIEGFFKKFADENPEIALVAQVTESVQTTPIRNGTTGGNKPSPANLSGPKTAKPNQANSMTDAEYREYKRTHGISY